MLSVTYRIMKKDDEYCLCEFYEFHNAGKKSWTEDPILCSSDISHVKFEVEMMLQAFDLPILDHKTGEELDV